MSLPRCAVVLDVGAYGTRVGLSRDPAPSTFPTIVCKAASDDGYVVGCEAARSEGRKIRPLDMLSANWDCLGKVYEHAFEVAGVEPSGQPVVLNRNHPLPRAQQEKTVQVMFEEFNVPGLHLNNSAVLALYGQDEGGITGLVVDSGFQETQIYPVYEGHVLERGLQRWLRVGGDDLTLLLQRKLQENDFDCDYDTANAIKEKHLYVSADLQEEHARDETLVIDNETIKLSTERFLVPEELYSSSMEYGGLHEYIFNTVCRCDPALRHILLGNILLIGGNTMLPGFARRLENELKNSLPDYKSLRNCELKIVALEDRQNLVWLGGTKLANLTTFEDMCMTLQDYDEYGPTLVHRKFF